MIVIFGDGVPELFFELPGKVKIKVANSIERLTAYPHMYPIRRRGLMKGYRYFVAASYLFYYQISGDEIRISAIIPGVMKRA